MAAAVGSLPAVHHEGSMAETTCMTSQRTASHWQFTLRHASPNLIIPSPPFFRRPRCAWGRVAFSGHAIDPQSYMRLNSSVAFDYSCPHHTGSALTVGSRARQHIPRWLLAIIMSSLKYSAARCSYLLSAIGTRLATLQTLPGPCIN